MLVDLLVDCPQLVADMILLNQSEILTIMAGAKGFCLQPDHAVGV